MGGYEGLGVAYHGYNTSSTLQKKIDTITIENETITIKLDDYDKLINGMKQLIKELETLKESKPTEVKEKNNNSLFNAWFVKDLVSYEKTSTSITDLYGVFCSWYKEHYESYGKCDKISKKEVKQFLINKQNESVYPNVTNQRNPKFNFKLSDCGM